MVKEKTNSTKEISDKMTEKDDHWMQKVAKNEVVEEESVEEKKTEG